MFMVINKYVITYEINNATELGYCVKDKTVS